MHESETRQIIADELRACAAGLDPEQVAACIFMELTTRAAVGDARMLRWCEWPGCLRSFHAATGPDPAIDGKGWIRVRNGDSILLCPDHADAGHRPQRVEWEPGWGYVNTSCECGARGERVTPASLDGNNRWWREHVEATTRTAS